MFKFCRHKWYIINKYPDDAILNMVLDSDHDSDLDDYIGSASSYVEKICLKCEKYVDEITPRYEYHLIKLLKSVRRLRRAKRILSKLERPKKVWESPRSIKHSIEVKAALKGDNYDPAPFILE